MRPVHTSGAVISPDMAYRYRLWRQWGDDRLAFVMLNPSTAGAEEDDPTIRKCMGFADRLGFGGIEVVNLFAWRSTCPDVLRHLRDSTKVGPENDSHIAAVLLSAPAVVAAWGANGRFFPDRVGVMRGMLARASSGDVLQLDKPTGSGQPPHPLMLPYDLNAVRPYALD